MADKEDLPEFEESEYEGILGGVIYKGRNCIVVGMKQLESKRDGQPKRFVDIREHYYMANEGRWQYTGKGVTLPIGEIEELRDILERLEGIIE